MLKLREKYKEVHLILKLYDLFLSILKVDHIPYKFLILYNFPINLFI